MAKPQDTLIHDLQVIVTDGWYRATPEGKLTPIDRDTVVQELLLLITKRDGEVLQHGIEVGKQGGNDGRE